VATDGALALESAELNPYDLLIVDVMLPGLNGLELCGGLRERGITAPVLMLTARGGLDERIAGLDAGADDYLAKPYHFPELLARIRALLRRGPALQSPILSIADLTVDTRARTVHRNGRAIDLTAKEYALLEYLVRRQGEVVSRTDIAEHVWDDSFDPMSNLIEVYIQRLRRRIDDGHVEKLIETRRGAGYTIALPPSRR
jgi:DNA-binding response OmpR family regulator